MAEDSVEVTPLFEEPPISSQNPLLAVKALHKFCEKRGLASSDRKRFDKCLRRCWKKGVALPVWSQEGRNYFSTFQVWEIEMARRFGILGGRWPTDWDFLPWPLRGFDRILRLLILTQDVYLPEVRSDLRVGEIRHFSTPALNGTHFSSSETLFLGALQERRKRLTVGELEPVRVLSTVGLTQGQLKRWVRDIKLMARAVDPNAAIRDLLRFVNISKRRKLTGPARVAEDFYEILDHLALFATDLGVVPDEPTLLQWQDCDLQGDVLPGHQWRRELYGTEALRRPFELLEYVANEFDVNPKPRAIILTEGEEYAALGRLYEELGAPPTQLGIEFKSLGGHGNFSISNWRYFVEYMHEKQVLVYFVLDREGQVARQAERLLDAKRRFESPGLKKVIPARDRIKIWKSSFEEDNFTDKQISRGLARQGITVPYQKVAAVRRRERERAVITALAEDLRVDVEKRLLTESLVEILIRDIQSDGKRNLTPIEEFVASSARLIALNHQPVDPGSVSRNRETGILG